ncbi:hypothetical protein RHA1_ro10247 (plasmid) [Rhodococcus jostii RHA1]|uniref:Uncharacterized protein n=1 Tax=Rhodococcus jostii (strain RHA1) TaxID=101510 RepID=Q0RW96_RHOJR|nr:hypothetical protein RHA1_ro10247 [Rhodococcus jostii RHA1]
MGGLRRWGVASDGDLLAWTLGRAGYVGRAGRTVSGRPRFLDHGDQHGDLCIGRRGNSLSRFGAHVMWVGYRGISVAVVVKLGGEYGVPPWRVRVSPPIRSWWRRRPTWSGAI